MIRKFFKLILVITIVLAAGIAETAVTQTESWQRIAPVGHSFTILMPGRATWASRRIPVNDKDSIPVAVYYSLAGGKRYVVAAFLKTSPDTARAFSSYEDFIQAMEYSFKSNGTAESLTLEPDLSL